MYDKNVSQSMKIRIKNIKNNATNIFLEFI